MPEKIILLYGLLFLVAFLYASVGHGGASGYLALMALFAYCIYTVLPGPLFHQKNISSIGIGLYPYGFCWRFTSNGWCFVQKSIGIITAHSGSKIFTFQQYSCYRIEKIKYAFVFIDRRIHWFSFWPDRHWRRHYFIPGTFVSKMDRSKTDCCHQRTVYFCKFTCRLGWTIYKGYSIQPSYDSICTDCFRRWIIGVLPWSNQI